MLRTIEFAVYLKSVCPRLSTSNCSVVSEELAPDVEERIKQKWRLVMGSQNDIVVCVLCGRVTWR